METSNKEYTEYLEKVKVSDPETYDLLMASDEYVDNNTKIEEREKAYSAFDRFAVNAVTTRGLTKRVSNLITERVGVDSELEWWNAQEGYHFPTITTLEDRLGRYGLNQEWKDAWDSGDPKRKAEVLDKLHQERVKEKYGDIALKEAPQTLADTLGEMFGYISDPTTLLPASTVTKGTGPIVTVANLAGIGGALGALDVAIGEYSEKGEVNPEHVGLGAAIGAIAPNALYFLGKGLGKLLDKYATRTGKSTVEAAQDIEKAIVEDKPIDILGEDYRRRWSELTDEDFYKKPLMEDMEYRRVYTDRHGRPKEVGGRPENISELPSIEEVDPYRNRWSNLTEEGIVGQKEGDTFRRRLFANVEEEVAPEVPEVDFETIKQAWMLAQTSPKTELLLDKVDNALSPDSGAINLEWRPHPWEKGTRGNEVKLLVPKDMTEEQFVSYARSLDKSPPPPEWKRSYAPFTKGYEFKTPEDVPYSAKSDIPNEEIKPGYIDPDNNVVVYDKETKTFYERRMTPKEREYKERKLNVQEVRKAKDNQYWEAKKKEEAFLKEEPYEAPEINFKGKALYDDVSYTSTDLYPESAAKRAIDRLSKRDKKALNDILNNQAGVTQLDVLSHMASSAIGGMYGFYENGWDGAVWGATLGLAAPTIIKHGWKGVKSLKDWSARDYTTSMAMKEVLVTGQSAIRGYGQAGRILAEKFDLYKEDVEMAVGEKIIGLMDSLYTNNFKKLSRVEKKQFLSVFRGVLDHTIPETDPRVTPEILRVVKEQRKAFDDVIDEAVSKGIYSQELGDKVKLNSKTNGYFPRIWDHAFLDSKEGKELFLDMFSAKWQDTDKAEALLKNIVGDDKLVSQYMTLTRKNGKQVQFTYDAAKRIFEHFGKMRRNVRSTHLEETRKLKGIDEDFLKTFMLKDPMAILKEYYADVYGRIKAVPHFHGINAKGTIDDHYKTNLLFEEIKRTHGPAAEEFAKENYYLLLKDSERSTTFRSLVGQSREKRKILQYLHAYATITKLSLAAIPNWVQGIVMSAVKASTSPISVTKLLSKEAIKLITGPKEAKHYADRLGSSLDLTLMEVFSEGTGEVGKMTERFLKVSTHLYAERFNRIFATNIGREYAIDLLDTYKKHLSGEKMLSPRRFEKLTKAIREMSLPTDRPVTVDDINRAAVRFNNQVNYVAAPYKMPLALQTPYGKIAGKFKTFTIQTSIFTRDNIIKPAVLFTATGGKEGTIKPLLMALVMAEAVGMPLDSLRRYIKEDDREFTHTEQLIRGLMMLGGLGFVQDFVLSFGSTIPGRVFQTVLGPIVSDAVKIGEGLAKTADKIVDVARNSDSPVVDTTQTALEGTFDTLQKQWVIPAPIKIRESISEFYKSIISRPTYTPRKKKAEQSLKTMKGYAEGGLVNTSGSDETINNSLTGEDYTQDYWKELWGIPTGGGGGSPMFSLKRDMLMQILGMGEFDASRRTPTATA